MGHNLPMAFFKRATILPTYLFLKAAQGGKSQLSCFIMFFSVGLTHPDNIYQQLSCGRTFATRGCTLARCLHVRTTLTCARSHPRKLPKRGKICAMLSVQGNRFVTNIRGIFPTRYNTAVEACWTHNARFANTFFHDLFHALKLPLTTLPLYSNECGRDDEKCFFVGNCSYCDLH